MLASFDSTVLSRTDIVRCIQISCFGLGQFDLYTTNVIDNCLKSIETDFDIAVKLDIKILRDRFLQKLDAAIGISCIKFVIAMSRNFNQHITHQCRKL